MRKRYVIIRDPKFTRFRGWVDISIDQNEFRDIDPDQTYINPITGIIKYFIDRNGYQDGFTYDE